MTDFHGELDEPLYDPPVSYGFRRRCSWCGVVLRGWQLNKCQLCRQAMREPGLPRLSQPPCPQASRWDAHPDEWRWRF